MKRLAVLLTVLVVGAGVAALASAEVATSRAKRTNARETFDSPGIHTWTSPQAGTVTFDVFGAQGQRNLAHNGSGGEARASFRVTAGETFEIVVGGEGSREGGFNGGGAGTNTGGGGGGGASDVRTGPCASSKACGLQSRIIVGGGGGGSSTAGAGEKCARDVVVYNPGGAGGGRHGANGTADTVECTDGEFAAGHGGTQTHGGAANCRDRFECDGSFGHGGHASSTNSRGGGGGGGWFGGGAGTGTSVRFGHADGGGGGGSGYISPFAESGSFPGGKQSGHGKVIVSFS